MSYAILEVTPICPKMKTLASFPVLMLAASIIVAVFSILRGSEAGLGFASGLTSAAGTAWQYRDNNGPNQP